MASIIYESDLLELSTKQAQIIAQQCNCVSSKTKGLSKDIITKFPYANFYNKDRKPGTIRLLGSPKKGNRLVLAMFSQRNPGKPVGDDSFEQREEWFLSCLRKISKLKGLKSIAFPFKIGCGLAGGNWKHYQSMIDDWVLDNTHIEVKIICQDTDPKTPIKGQIPDDYEFLKWAWEQFKESHLINTDSLQRYWIDNELMKECKRKSKENFEESSDNDFVEHSKEDSQEESQEGNFEEDSNSSHRELNPTYETMTFGEYIDEFTPPGWEDFFETIGGEDSYISDLSVDISKKVKSGETIYPPLNEVFTAFDCHLSDIKVIIIGQDPYHNHGAAMGLAFSVPEEAKIQPSLRNIFKELRNDGFKDDPTCGDLFYWVDQGVFLINTALTVAEGQPDSNKNIWVEFTRQLFIYINKMCKHLVIIMWGGKAKKLGSVFSSKKHHKITGGHPSPLNKSVEFLGTKPFSKTNKQLKRWGYKPIDWNLVD